VCCQTPAGRCRRQPVAVAVAVAAAGALDTALCAGSRQQRSAGFAIRSLPDLTQLGSGDGEQQPGAVASLSSLHGIDGQRLC
jgi:hypothetical protein